MNVPQDPDGMDSGDFDESDEGYILVMIREGM